jgi:hypothetical protein
MGRGPPHAEAARRARLEAGTASMQPGSGGYGQFPYWLASTDLADVDSGLAHGTKPLGRRLGDGESRKATAPSVKFVPRHLA